MVVSLERHLVASGSLLENDGTLGRERLTQLTVFQCPRIPFMSDGKAEHESVIMLVLYWIHVAKRAELKDDAFIFPVHLLSNPHL